MKTNLIGNYNFENGWAAIAIGKYLDVSEDAIIYALESYLPENNRSQLMQTKKNSLIIDAYNANPTSMAAALSNFENILHSTKALILGDMLELGDDSLQEHINVLEKVDKLNAQKIYIVGKEFEQAYNDIKQNLKSEIHLFPNSKELSMYIDSNPLKGHLILIKGSRGTRLEQVVDHL